MFSLGSGNRFYLYGSPVDMRKSFDGLHGLVSSHTGRDPLSGDVFVFLNKSRTLIKLLHWEHGGFVLYYKRLEKGTFVPPSPWKGRTVSWPELVLMVEGIKVERSRQSPRYVHGR
ncbi:IS66 family insertion sequence element accessory protein TnpB [Echinicola sediminis]